MLSYRLQWPMFRFSGRLTGKKRLSSTCSHRLFAIDLFLCTIPSSCSPYSYTLWTTPPSPRSNSYSSILGQYHHHVHHSPILTSNPTIMSTICKNPSLCPPRFVDRCRTTNNMMGDCYCAAVVEALSRKVAFSLIIVLCLRDFGQV